jgi:hypothetical protein
MNRAGTAFRVNLAINIVIVIVGLAFVGIAIYSFFAKGVDLSSSAFAGLGTVDLVSTFFVNPQKGVQKSIDNLTAIQVAYRTYLVELENYADVERQLKEGKQLTVDLVEKINNDISQLTSDTMSKIANLSAETQASVDTPKSR